jgi:ankyrin repeat protein
MLPDLVFIGYANMIKVDADLGLGTIDATALESIDYNFPYYALRQQPGLYEREDRLRAVLPVSVVESENSPLVEISGSQLHYFHAMMYLISNNIMNIPSKLLTLLEDHSHKRLLLSLLHLKTPTTRVFVQKLFIRAIGARNATIIDTVLNSGVFPDYWKYDSCVPVVAAIQNENIGLASRLLAAGADARSKSGKKALRKAAERGKIELVQLLLEAGADVNAREPETSATALEKAIRQCNIEMVQFLIEKGADVNVTESYFDYKRVIELAVEKNNTRLVQVLINAGAVVNTLTTEPYAHLPLSVAVKNGNIDLVQLLIGAGAAVNTWAPGNRTSSPLFTAVCKGYVDHARILIDAGAAVDRLEEYCMPSGNRRHYEGTALHKAIEDSSIPLVRLLLDVGADVNVMANSWEHRKKRETKRQETILQIAAHSPNGDIIRLLIATNSTMVAHSGVYALHAAVHLNDPDLVYLLLGADADINATPTDDYSGTVLQEAVRKRRHSMAILLLSVGANVNAPGSGLCGTALQEAASIGDLSTAQLLIETGAEINAPVAEFHGRTTLQSAVWNGNLELVELLLDSGAEVNTPGGREYGTALRIAAQKCNNQLVDRLLCASADINPPSFKGITIKTPLQAAAEADNLEIAKTLLEMGADINAGSKDWRGTALQAAAKRGSCTVVEFLLRHGADINAISHADSYGTALLEAVNKSHMELVRILLRYNANPNVPGSVDFHGKRCQKTPLQLATEMGSVELSQLLVKAGARADILPAGAKESRTPLESVMVEFYADPEDQLVMVGLMLESGADVNLAFQKHEILESHRNKYCYMRGALHVAVRREDVQMVQLLLDAGADVNKPARIILQDRNDSSGDNLSGNGSRGYDEGCLLYPLQLAAWTSSTKIATLLLHAGADAKIDSPFLYWWWELEYYISGTLLAVAVRRSTVEMVHLLINAGANVNVPAVGHFGRTALQAAVEKGNIDLVELLIKLGADVSAPPSYDSGATALQLAAMCGHAGIFSMLLEQGADIGAKGAVIGGRTALEGAAEHGRLDLVRMLLNEINSRGTPGQKYEKAVELALEEGYEVIADMILAEMGSVNNA